MVLKKVAAIILAQPPSGTGIIREKKPDIAPFFAYNNLALTKAARLSKKHSIGDAGYYRYLLSSGLYRRPRNFTESCVLLLRTKSATLAGCTADQELVCSNRPHLALKVRNFIQFSIYQLDCINFHRYCQLHFSLRHRTV